jgi:hypothetical protein
MAIQNNFPNLTPTLLLDFANAGKLDPRVTFSRATTATYFNSLGVLTTANNNVARFDYDPSTLAPLGLLIEEQRTNSIRNNTMQGAVAGAPGTMPTNWNRSASPTSGISNEIVGTGTESGITYIDLRFTGTATATISFNINFETTTQVAASPSQTWAISTYVKLTAGVLNSATFSFTVGEYSSVPAFLRNNFSSTTTPTSAGLATQRVAYLFTTGASTASIQPQISVNLTNGLTYDFTLRIGLPQLELGAFATSVIPTTTTALTRNADVASMTGTNFSSWFNPTASTLYAEWTNIAAAIPSGVIQGIISIEDSSANNFYRIFQSQAAGAKASANMFSGGVNPGRLDSGGTYSNAPVKAASAFAALDRAISANGSVATASATGALPVTVTIVFIGHQNAGINNINGYIRRIAYYPVRVTNAQLQALTG